MSDLVERLRNRPDDVNAALKREAAAEIERLREQLASARKALEFYASPKNYSDDYRKGLWKTAQAALTDDLRGDSDG